MDLCLPCRTAVVALGVLIGIPMTVGAGAPADTRDIEFFTDPDEAPLYSATFVPDPTFCKNAQDLEFFRERALDPSNRIAFKNPADGALGLKTGLCWWHSRLQRSLIYLAHPRPLKLGEKPMSTKEIKNVIAHLIKENSVVELRGYKSIFEFTKVNKNIIHAKLKWWQALEAINAGQGLKGKPVVSAQKMQTLMHGLYDFVENKKLLAYEMLQYPGVTAHAWLVTHMTPVYENLLSIGYDIAIIDSNYPLATQIFNYRYGQTHFKGDFGSFTPYLQWQTSPNRYSSSISQYCERRALANGAGINKIAARLEE